MLHLRPARDLAAGYAEAHRRRESCAADVLCCRELAQLVAHLGGGHLHPGVIAHRALHFHFPGLDEAPGIVHHA